MPVDAIGPIPRFFTRTSSIQSPDVLLAVKVVSSDITPATKQIGSLPFAEESLEAVEAPDV